jgi:hypothetical protein
MVLHLTKCRDAPPTMTYEAAVALAEQMDVAESEKS